MVYSVLIIEDDPMVLSINKRYLEKIPGFAVGGVAKNFDTAIQLTSKYSYDLLLIDIHLDGNNGLDLIKSLRKREYPADFIMITAVSENKAIQICSRYGVIDYILKPFHFERFKKSIQLFEQRQKVLRSAQPITQKDLDAFYSADLSGEQNEPKEMEKGLTQSTLNVILKIIDRQKDRFTVNDITKETDLSHVSVRKYLHYLDNKNLITAKQEYGTIGRPTTIYYKLKEKEAENS